MPKKNWWRNANERNANVEGRKPPTWVFPGKHLADYTRLEMRRTKTGK